MAVAALPDRMDLGPLQVVSAERPDAIDRILDGFGRGQCVTFVNTHLLYFALRRAKLARDLQSFTLLNDGVGVDLLARCLHGRRFADNLNGTDLVPALLKRAPAGARLFLYGGRPEVSVRVAQRITRLFPDLNLVGAFDGYSNADAGVRAALANSKPDIVLVALGNPLQEEWIAQHARVRPEAVFLGVGALFDFLADSVPRAPPLIRSLRLEWLFRLAREPGRLWRRYTVEIGYVVLALLGERLRRPQT